MSSFHSRFRRNFLLKKIMQLVVQLLSLCKDSVSRQSLLSSLEVQTQSQLWQLHRNYGTIYSQRRVGKRISKHLHNLLHLKKIFTKIQRIESQYSPNQFVCFFSPKAKLLHLESKIEKKWPSPTSISLTNHKQLFAYHSNASELLPLHKAFPASFQLQTQTAAVQKTGEL